MRFRESGRVRFQGRVRAGTPEEVGLTLSGTGWVKYRPGRWVRVNEYLPGRGPCVCESVRLGIMR